MLQTIKERFVGILGSISGFTSFLGSWQICHNVCLWLVTLLGILGITVVGMPLLFLTKIAVYIWTVAFLMLLLTLWFYFKKSCISKKMVYLNSGLVLAGVPFFQNYSWSFWISGGILVLISIFYMIKDLRRKHGR